MVKRFQEIYQVYGIVGVPHVSRYKESTLSINESTQDLLGIRRLRSCQFSQIDVDIREVDWTMSTSEKVDLEEVDSFSRRVHVDMSNRFEPLSGRVESLWAGISLYGYITSLQSFKSPKPKDHNIKSLPQAMASTTILIIVLSLAISTQSILSMDILCEDLDEKSCAFSVSSFEKRCVLESRLRMSGTTAYTCGTSEIVADKIRNLVETDEYIRSCGVDRQALGISSDSLLDRRFTQSLCSRACYNNCPNIVDLYFNLAAGEDHLIEITNIT
ncbi:PAR1 protein [Striga asiatica]|uniref:PAR1 protein n=1 Tax=Striga asiatica TaxID=4170 RepID=A0A5A7PK01_STRAF|nr:PAR1 protein [Striga asiatica]